MATWPPVLAELKVEMKEPAAAGPDDVRLQSVLDASVSFVERVRASAFNFVGELGPDLPEPTADLRLGTLRLAVRWHTRRRSPDALIQLAEMGASRVPSFDPDIDRLLGIGRYQGPVFA